MSDAGVVFISHEKSDDALAHEIRDHLAAGGFSCWMAPDDIRGPMPWPEQIAKAIDSCDVMLVVVSVHANGSPHVSREVDLAVEKGKPLLPVRVEDIVPTGSLDYLLRLAQWIDLFPGSVADHAASLQGMVGSMLGERGLVPPPAPPPAVEPEPPRRARRRIPRRVLLAGGSLVVVLIAAVALIAALQGDDGPGADGDEPGSYTRVSVASDGSEADDHSVNPSISADGRYIAFDSLASNLVDDDSGQWRDVFVHDRETGETIRISEVRVGQAFGEEAFGPSRDPQISADGDRVIYVSEAPNLVPFGDDQNDAADIFMWDRTSGATTLVSGDVDGRPLHTLNSIDPAMSDDGTLIAYATYAGDITPPDELSLGVYSVWVADVSGESSGVPVQIAAFEPEVGIVSPPAVSADGSVVAASGHQAGVVSYDRGSGATTDVEDLVGRVWREGFVLSGDGSRWFFSSWASDLVPDDLNGQSDLFVYSPADRGFDMVWENTAEDPDAPPQVVGASDDGRCVAFMDPGPEWAGVVCDGVLTRIGGVGVTSLDLSGDARWGAFSTLSGEIVDGDSNGKQDVFVVELPGTGDGGTDEPGPSADTSVVGSISRVSVDSGGAQSEGPSANPDISADGRFVAFDSFGSLVDPQGASSRNVFVHDRATGETTRVSHLVGDDGVIEEANGDSWGPEISGDGRFVAFVSDASNLNTQVDLGVAPGEDGNGTSDIFLHDRVTGDLRLISLAPDGSQHLLNSIDPSMSDDGTVIAYATYAGDVGPGPLAIECTERGCDHGRSGGGTGLYTVWVHDVAAGRTTRLADFDATILTPFAPRVSRDGSVAVANAAGTVAVGGAEWKAFILDVGSGLITSPESPPDSGPPGFWASLSSAVPVIRAGERPLFTYLTPADPHLPEGTRPSLAWLVIDSGDGEIHTGSGYDVTDEGWLVPEDRTFGPLDTGWVDSVSSDGMHLSVIYEDGTAVRAVVWDFGAGTTTDFGSIRLGAERPADVMPAFDLNEDGRMAAFASAETLVEGDTNGVEDIFVIQLED